jgi:Tfp pilus assembly protein PilO
VNRPYEPPPGQKRPGNPFASRAGWALFVTLIVGICLVYFMVIRQKQNEQLATLRRRAMQLEEKQAWSREKAEHLAVYRKTTERLRMQILEAEKRIPAGLEIPSLTEAIMRTAGQYSVTVTRFEPGTASRTGGLTRLPVQLEMKGTRESLFAFFLKLTSLLRRVNVLSLSIARIPEQGGDSLVKIGCEVEAFALESPK